YKVITATLASSETEHKQYLIIKRNVHNAKQTQIYSIHLYIGNNLEKLDKNIAIKKEISKIQIIGNDYHC
ncbi:TPA: hypothetical protein ACIT4C_004536, partial [Salmonella enterica subsp. enterica serovar Saintpaul]